MKIATIVGTRPQFIKSAVVSRAIAEYNAGAPSLEGGICECVIHTGQHFDLNMSQVFFDELDIPEPDHRLGVQEDGHGRMTGRMLAALEEILLQESPDMVLIYGDTNSTLAGALATAKLHIPIAHVEAGLRSYNRSMPEEVNRVLVDQLSTLLFCPTQTAVRNLELEGYPHQLSPHTEQLIIHVGDVMYDAARYYADQSDKRSAVLEKHGLVASGYILATIHRAENTDDLHKLQHILDALALVGQKVPVVLPLHPRTAKMLSALPQSCLSRCSSLITFIDPVGYLDMVMLEKKAKLVVTDSGGVQKEAFFHGVPCVTLREETEWVELVAAGWNLLCPPHDPGHMAMTIQEAMCRSCPPGDQLYGQGTAGQKIVKVLADSSSSLQSSERNVFFSKAL